MQIVEVDSEKVEGLPFGAIEAWKSLISRPATVPMPR